MRPNEDARGYSGHVLLIVAVVLGVMPAIIDLQNHHGRQERAVRGCIGPARFSTWSAFGICG